MTASSDDHDDHLRCAAMIAAADKLIQDKTVAADPLLRDRALIASMTHLNAYAIPQNLSERHAFAAANAERDRLLGTLAPAEIMERAKACLERTPST